MGDKQTALITGASTGIGYELAKVFAREGYELILVARGREKLAALCAELEKAHGTRCTFFTVDLSTAGAPEELHEKIVESGQTVDVLVNNAGIGLYGAFAEADERQTMQMLHLNVVALTHLTRLFLPAMVKRRSGKIMNVASTAAFQPGPLMAVYYASKAYVLHFSEALSNELRDQGVTVTALCPGPTQSNFSKTAKMEKSPLFQKKVMDSATVAEAGFRALASGRAIEIPGLSNRLLAMTVRFAPRKMVTAISRRVVESVG